MSGQKAARDPSFGRRRKIVGVMGSGVDTHSDLSTVAGQTIARLGCHLLTGGGGGVMEAVSRAFAETRPREGAVIGVVRADGDTHFSLNDGGRVYSHRALNDFVEIPIFTHLPDSSAEPTSRNHINVLTSDVVLVLPGGSGTLSELELAAEYDWTLLLLFLGDQRVNGMNGAALVAKKAPNARIIKSESALEGELSRVLGL